MDQNDKFEEDLQRVIYELNANIKRGITIYDNKVKDLFDPIIPLIKQIEHTDIDLESTIFNIQSIIHDYANYILDLTDKQQFFDLLSNTIHSLREEEIDSLNRKFLMQKYKQIGIERHNQALKEQIALRDIIMEKQKQAFQSEMIQLKEQLFQRKRLEDKYKAKEVDQYNPLEWAKSIGQEISPTDDVNSVLKKMKIAMQQMQQEYNERQNKTEDQVKDVSLKMDGKVAQLKLLLKKKDQELSVRKDIGDQLRKQFRRKKRFREDVTRNNNKRRIEQSDVS
ncbi:MAG: hypothetical protein EZS28_018573 [Streblomastix strix]|uniref:Uncharacterized protein n=1 Tax=Streblomastix strix TaxID=222440 RepID=A0A5J4VTE2_9EUKA|nr:MAG: hypothetical protein EZS28_018573 [Streblomastix strix]